jgi:aryl-alcohol dehydrogenase-like predicted oxidoreductase
VREALQASLERLQTDYLDVYMFHSFDPGTPMEEALAAMDEAQQSGLIRCAGGSNFSGPQLRDALNVGRRLGLRRLEVVEGICNLAAREAEADLLPLCRDEQVGFLGYSPLGAGFLSGKYSGDRNSLPAGSRFHVIPGHADIYFSERNFRIVEQLRQGAERRGVPALRLAIAWVLAHPAVTTVLCGARNTSHLDNALAASQMEAPVEWPDELRPVAE